MSVNRYMVDDRRGHIKLYKKEARAVLCYRSNWIGMLFVWFALFFFVYCAFYFSDCFYYAIAVSGISTVNSTLLAEIYRPVSFLVLFLLLTPLYPGFLSYLYDLYRSQAKGSGHVPPTELFCYYANLSSAMRAWVLSLIRILVYLLIPVFVWLFITAERFLHPLFTALHPIAGFWIKNLLLCSIGFLILLAVFCCNIHADIFTIYAVTRPELPLRVCYQRSRTFIRRHMAEGMWLDCSFLPWLFLSILSAGILFFFYVLPYYLFTFISFYVHISAETDITTE